MITFVEVIEHLYESQIPEANYSIFGYLRPKFVIVTTPNQ